MAKPDASGTFKAALRRASKLPVWAEVLLLQIIPSKS